MQTVAAFTHGLTAQVGWFDLRTSGHPTLSSHSSMNRVNYCNGSAMMTAP